MFLDVSKCVGVCGSGGAGRGGKVWERVVVFVSGLMIRRGSVLYAILFLECFGWFLIKSLQ